MSCYTYRNHDGKSEIFAATLEMLNSFKIFTLVFVLLAKFTMSFLGSDLGGIATVKASVHSAKDESGFHSELCLIDECESKTESKEESGDKDQLYFENSCIEFTDILSLQAAYTFLSYSSLHTERRFLLFGNFRI